MARATSRTKTAKQSASQRPTPRPTLPMKTAEYATAAASRRRKEICTRISTPKSLPKGIEERSIDVDCRREQGLEIRDQGLGLGNACDCGGVSIATAGDAARHGDAADERQAARDAVQCAGRERGGREVCGSLCGLGGGGD